MDLSLGTPTQGIPDNTITQGPSPASEKTAGTASTEAQLPLVEQPVQDQISKFGQLLQPLVTSTYNASVQVPTLPKPAEPNSEKKDTKTAEKDSKAIKQQTDQQQTDASLMQADGEQKPHDGQQEDGQPGGGSGGGNQGSDSNNSGSQGFSGGGDRSNKEPENSVSITVEANTTHTLTASTAATVNQTAKVTGEAPQSTPDAKALYLQEINPLYQATGVSASGLFSPPVNPAQFFDNGGKLMAELHDINVKFASSMPDGPDKMRFIDFLKIVQQALTDFQQLLRELQMKDSKGAQDRTKARLETTLAKIETQRKEQEEMNKKSEEAAKKAKIMGPLSTIFAFLLVVMLAVLLLVALPFLIFSGPAGWMAIALIVSEMVDQASKVLGKKPFVMEKLVEVVTAFAEAIAESCEDTFDLSKDQVKQAKLITKTVVMSLSMALTVTACPGVYIFGGCTALLSFLNESHIIRDMQIQAGHDEADAAKAEMYAGIALGAAFAVAAFATAFIMPASLIGSVVSNVSNALSAAAKAAAQFITKMITMALEIGDVASKKIMGIIHAIIETLLNPDTWVQVTSLGLQTTNAVSTYKYQSILADIAIIQGRMDSEVELKDATIDTLKKIIKMLLDGLQGLGEDISKVGQLLKKTHSGVSEITSNLPG